MNTHGSSQYRLTLPAALIAIGLSIAGITIGWAITHVKRIDRYVTVKGLAEHKVHANEAIWKIDFSYSSNTLGDLYDGIAKAQKTVNTFLLNKGFALQNLQIEPVTVVDNETNSYAQNAKMKRFKANASIVLLTDKVSDVVKSAQETSTLVQSGILIGTSTVRYLFTRLNQIKPTMLNGATLHAQKAAETFAKNSHSQLNGIRRATQGLFTIKNADGSYGESDPLKKLRVVTTVEYFLR